MPIFAKIATSLDGKVALHNGKSKWLTCLQAREKVHELRASADFIATGIGTVLADDCSLSARTNGEMNKNQPQKVVFDTLAKTPIGAKILEPANELPTVILHSDLAGYDRLDELRRSGATLIQAATKNGGLNIQDALEKLKLADRNLMLEAGGKLFSSFLSLGLIDRIYWFRAPVILGENGKNAIQGMDVDELTDAMRLKLVDISRIGSDILEIYEK